MKVLRALALPALLAVGFGMFAAAATPATAGGRITAPGVYDASIVYIPGISVPGGLPDCVDKFAQQIYVGKLTVAQSAAGYTLSFAGENQDDASLSLRASAEFNASWGGFLLGDLGGRDDALLGIDVANLVSGRIHGRILGENGNPGNLLASIGPGGSIERCKFVGRGAK
jgi:hypothetical protein